MTLDDVEDIETLRRAAKMLESENLQMAKMITRLKRELFELKNGRPEQLKLELQIAELEEQLARRNKLLFGDKSEKSKREIKSAADKPKQTGHGRREQPELEVVEQVHVQNVEDETCELCGGGLHASKGFFEESEEIDIIERKFVIKKHRRQKYKCECGSCIKTAPGPLKLFDGARYSINFALHVAINKYADHLPLERQVRGMLRDGLTVDSQTLWDQIERLAALLAPAYGRQKLYVLSQPVIGADETHWKLMGESAKKNGGKGKRWQAWAICCADAVHYNIEDSRSAEAAKKVLEDFSGVAITDGYAVYESVKKQGGKFTLAHCWAHVRRKYIEADEQHPGKCSTVLDLIGQLYEIEAEARGKPPDEVLALRREKSKPIVLAIQKWALEAETLPESGLGRAIAYMGALWDGLRVFLDNPSVSLDNNGTERALRGIVLGRKNHYGSRSVRGTEVAALFYTLIESAKLAGVGPHTYLQAAINAALRGVEIPLPHEMR
jgi:transposase